MKIVCFLQLKKFFRPALARPSPAQVMQNRFLEKQKRLAAESKLQKEKSLTNLPSKVSTLRLFFLDKYVL